MVATAFATMPTMKTTIATRLTVTATMKTTATVATTIAIDVTTTITTNTTTRTNDNSNLQQESVQTENYCMYIESTPFKIFLLFIHENSVTLHQS